MIGEKINTSLLVDVPKHQDFLLRKRMIRKRKGRVDIFSGCDKTTSIVK